jgi:hypothetical protein
MAKQYLDWDPQSGIGHWVDTDESTGLTTYGFDQDATQILEQNKTEYVADHGRYEDFTHVASNPMAKIYEWALDGSLFDVKVMKRRLNDSDYRKFRTRPGRI